MTSGPMRFGMGNDSGEDTTVLSCNGASETLRVQNLQGKGGDNPRVAVSGESLDVGVKGWSEGVRGAGVLGETYGVAGDGVRGVAHGSAGPGSIVPFGNRSTGVYGEAGDPDCNAAFFNGRTVVWGDFYVGGAKHFIIDHPLDPENRYLLHTCVESPDPLNVYSGTVVTDQEGKAVVELPEYFEALNTDVRYHLTVIGGFAQAVVAEEVLDNRFIVATDKPQVKVSWQVSGVRQDAYTKANPHPVEQEKHESERGTYIHPEAWGKPKERGWTYERDAAHS
ncbi:hypothetical protein ACIBL8_47185 [Streptomyces sp. NPDC050523]|uniref:hypothetical protein n=1 Tax=Streptomyces sp. NPDC050523 TaxID=3365622 RepID=UPI003796E8E2